MVILASPDIAKLIQANGGVNAERLRGANGEDHGEMSTFSIGNPPENQGPIHDPNDTVPVVVPRQDGSVEEIPQALKDFLDQMRMKQMGKKRTTLL